MNPHTFKLLIKIILPEIFLLPTVINRQVRDAGTGTNVEKQRFHLRKQNSEIKSKYKSQLPD